MFNSLLIINADDFGYNFEVNHAISASFSRGLCSSTTIMANMPGFEKACELCRENSFTDRVGLHLVLSEGTPLSDKIKKCSRFCNNDGHFHYIGRKHFFKLSTREKEAVAEEISIQIDRCRKHDLPLSHIDSHCHIHVEWGIAGILLRVAKNKGLRFVRLSRHLDPNSTFVKNLYRRFLNFRIMLNSAAATRYFGTVEDFIRLRQNGAYKTNSFEIMIHPAFNKEGVLIDDISKEPLDQYIARVYGYENAIPFSCI